MALSVKLDPEDIPSILSILGIGGLPKQASDSGGSDDFAASGGVATHPGFGGGGDGQVYQPDVNYSDAKANTDAQGMSNNPPPIDPSLGGSGDPTAQPSSTISMIAGRNSAPPPVQTQAPATTKLDQLRNFLNPQAGQPQPQNLDDALMSPAGQEPIVPRRSLSDVFAGRPAVAPPQTWVQKHPTASKVLGSVANFVQDASAGVGATTFGEGAQAAVQSGQRRRALALQNAKSTADIAHTQAETQAILNPPGKPNATQLEFDKAGNLIGFRDQRGNLIGPNNANLTPDQKSMLDAAEGRATAAGTPEAQVMSYLVKNGKTPAEAYQFIQDSKVEARPDTATQDKQRGRQLENKLSAGTLTPNERDELTARQQEAKLQGIPSEIVSQVGRPPVPAQFPQGKSDPDFLAADKDWGTKVEAVKSREAGAAAGARGQAYGEFKPVQVIDPSTGELRWTYARDAISSGAAPVAGGVKAMSQQQQFKEMSVASSKARDAINGLDRDFTAPQIAKLTLAFSHDDPGIISNEVRTILGTQELTPKQEDFVVWLNQLNERALSLRNVAGMGQGAQDLRSAIQSTLPSLRSGGKSMALKQLDAFDNQVDLLKQGIPKVRGANGTSSTPQNNNSGGSSLTGPITPDETSKGLTAAGPGGHTLVFRGGKWIDPNTGVEAK